MHPSALLALTVNPCLEWMRSELGVNSDDRHRVMLLAIAQQESGLKYRRQVGGPAVSWWQFEKGGGVKGVLTHPVSYAAAKLGCNFLCVPFETAAVYEAMPQNDLLACMMARLLLLTDPRPMPQIDDAAEGWAYYIRNWRPGKPHPETWPGYHITARKAVLVSKV